MDEVIKPIDWAPKYSVSNTGQVIGKRGKPLKPHINHAGYERVIIHVDGVQKCRFVHCLIAEAFLGPKPDGLVCRHLDGNSRNNFISNLEYSTVEVNLADRWEHGTMPAGVHHYKTKLTNRKLRIIHGLSKLGYAQRKIARICSVSQTTVSNVIRNQVTELYE